MPRSILDVLTDTEQLELRRHAGRPKYKAREHIFHEGDLAKSLHIIEQGIVAVKRTTPLGDETTFTVLGPGASFGELALVSERRERTATVVALRATRTLEIHVDVFNELRAQHPGVERLLVAALVENIERLSTQLVDSHYVPIEKQLARRLLEIADVFGGRIDGTEFTFTQEDLASLVGTTRQTVNKILKDWESDQLLTVSRGRITLDKADGLVRRAR